jgi:chemotaxis protein methyltransferase CheR
MSEHLNALADLIRDVAGLRLEQTRHHALRAALARAWPGASHADVLRRALDPGTGPAIVALLIDEVTIKETSFLRDRGQLASIDWHGLLAGSRATGSNVVRVWSAACATGAEPYSLALLACEAFASTTPPVRIFATDISSSAIACAAAGRYGTRTVQGVEEPLRGRYLERSGNDFTVVPALRELVAFATHNLVADAYPPPGQSSFHLILCRNVLIYFDAETCARVAAGLERALVPGGRLVLGVADALCVRERTVAAPRRSARPSGPKAAPPPGKHRPRPAPPVEIDPRPSSRPTGDLMDPDAHYLLGLDELESGDAAAAVSSLRRVLYLDPEFELAAFALGRAHEEVGEPDAARRRYEQALRMLDARPEPGERLAGPIDAATLIDACEARLTALTHTGSSGRAPVVRP